MELIIFYSLHLLHTSKNKRRTKCLDTTFSPCTLLYAASTKKKKENCMFFLFIHTHMNISLKAVRIKIGSAHVQIVI